MFWTKITCPFSAFLTAVSNSSPRVQFTNWTGLPNNSCKRTAAHSKLFLALSSSVFTFPKCENNTTAFGSCSSKYLIVGKAWTIRLSFVISPVFLSLGTLKSTRTKTVYPFTSISLIVFLFIFLRPPCANYIILLKYCKSFSIFSYDILRWFLSIILTF